MAFVGAALYAKADDPWGLDHADAYDVLDVPFDASREQIRQAYKARSKELHPDKLRRRGQSSKAFLELRKAYDIVGFPRSKKKYDKEARKRHKHAPRRAENTLAADLAGDRKPINVVVGRLESGRDAERDDETRAVIGLVPGVFVAEWCASRFQKMETDCARLLELAAGAPGQYPALQIAVQLLVFCVAPLAVHLFQMVSRPTFVGNHTTAVWMPTGRGTGRAGPIPFK